MMRINLAASAAVAGCRPPFAVLPVGAFEQHGPCLPLTTDTLIAAELGARLAEAHGALLLSPVTISCSHEHAGFAGTVSISAPTLYAVVRDIHASLAAAGIERLALVNAHGGNYVLANLAQELNVGGPRLLILPTPGAFAAAAAAAGIETPPETDMHGGEIETSILLHACPKAVTPGAPDEVNDDRDLLHAVGMTGLTRSGVIGRPGRASAAKGARLLEALTGRLGDDLRTVGWLPADASAAGST
jgi:creatinine amidohydrolase